jgi:flagellar protein FliO/FliZ
MTPGFSSFLWFIAIVAMIPLALWLLKRTPLGGAASGGFMRSVAVMPLSASQRLVTVEVGNGADKRWLVLGVTPQSITTLHTMAPQAENTSAQTNVSVPAGFAQMLNRIRQNGTASKDAS